MKRILFLFPLCIMMLFSSCADIKGVSVSTNGIKKIVKNEITSDDRNGYTAPSAAAAPTVASVKDNSKEQADAVKDIKQYNGHYYKGRAVVLTYHHISDKPFSSITIKPQRFESDLKLLKDNGFNVISLSKMINCMHGLDTMPENAVVITFDDGIESFYKYAYPLLKKYNVPAANFIITSRTESYSPSKEDFNPLSPDEIREMYSSGIIDIQSHTDDSHDYVIINEKLEKAAKLPYKIYDPASKTYESDDAYVKRVSEDLRRSSDVICSYTGAYPQMLCFPFGSYNKKVIEIAKQYGFKYFITTQYGYNKEKSNSNMILRIRAGDANLNSAKLMQNIVDCGNNIKRVKAKDTEVKTNTSKDSSIKL